ncbi:hypothetical protein M0R88_11390 [Halorussus gelatinilyticus]|uniref:Uncharacterized protein n=1 Tax=Halorussus gelatinilyticus TaxID=2937524 RepID=A0A8U0IDJ7_9EURY|nr:hypothetical protein [Halorussus gelatinilyticus]UPV99129.1 hypothetical protein M0R88_11390 [Halorussus gelatinilyticus]
MAALAGLPLAASGTASAATDHNHLGDFWKNTSLGDTGLTIEVGSSNTMILRNDYYGNNMQVINNDGDAIFAYSANKKAIDASGKVYVDGNLEVTGQKNFVQTVQTANGEKGVAYTAVEADQAQTETTGVAEFDGGRAEIDLPERFGMVTSDDEDLVVQLTPYDVDVPGLAVTERTTDHIVVESRDGTGDFEFSYTVRGVREGFEDADVVRDSA